MDDEEQDDLREKVDELCELDEGLTPWEVTFVDDMSRWTGRFTEKQAEIIERVHRERT